MNTEIIFARDPNGVIGVNGKLPWHLPEDLKHFKQLTKGHPVLMGRKTWESLPVKPLPGRCNFVLSSKLMKDVQVFYSYTSAIKFLSCYFDKVFIIGGSNVYTRAMLNADVIHMTVVNTPVAVRRGDTVNRFKPDLSRFVSTNVIKYDTHTYTRLERRFT